jgi:hypothetical protein
MAVSRSPTRKAVSCSADSPADDHDYDAWKMRQIRPGVFEWTRPLSRKYRTQAEPLNHQHHRSRGPGRRRSSTSNAGDPPG